MENPQSNTTPYSPNPIEPIQNQVVAEPVTEEVRPSLARRLHLKLFSLLAFIVLAIFAVLYYRSHPLPDFVTSQADKLPGSVRTGEALETSIILQDEEGGSTQNTQRMIIESVGRSETTYRLVSTVPGNTTDNLTLAPTP
jgi:hypothetical protein